MFCIVECGKHVSVGILGVGLKGGIHGGNMSVGAEGVGGAGATGLKAEGDG